MERGVYFDGWYKNNHCYHPSLPMRSMQMIEDLERYHGTVLVWSILGGGSISLPYLEHEAFGEVDPRLRFYGFMNDSEFIEECNKRGIKPFGIVFEVQGWEFPAKFSEDGKHFRSFNVDRNGSCDSWYGLREFTANQHVEAFGKRFEDYYPEGLVNSDGEPVTNLWEECCARDMYGNPVHTEWVEVKDHRHIAYQMCRNNPVWRDYLKKIIKIQIDAGVPGVQLDECELPMSSIRYGGCFCKDCMKQFNAYMNRLKQEGKLPEDVSKIDFDDFNYGAYLRETGLPYPGNIEDLPLYHYYWDYQMEAVKKHFTELADYIKAYGKEKGRDVLVSGNFFNILPVYYPIREQADIIITEQAQTVLREVAWYRYVAGFAGEKDVIIAENPYGSQITEYIHQWEEGKGYDMFLQLMMEGNVYGCNMSVPYGSWMGNVEKDAFWPPRELMTAIQDYIYENDGLFSKKSGSKILVLYSLPSNYWRETIAGYSSNSVLETEGGGTLSFGKQDENDPDSIRQPFWEVSKTLAEKQVYFDVKFMADGNWHEDDFTPAAVQDYDLVILPDCFEMTQNQADVLKEYVLKSHGKLLLFGENGKNLGAWEQEVKQLPNVFYCANGRMKKDSMEKFSAVFDKLYPELWNIQVDNPQVSYGVHVLKDGLAVHLINYDFDEEKGCTRPVPVLHLALRDNISYGTDLRVLSVRPEDIPRAEVTTSDGETQVTLYDVPAYCALHWTGTPEGGKAE